MPKKPGLKITWKGDEVVKKLRESTLESLEECADTLLDECNQTLVERYRSDLPTFGHQKIPGMPDAFLSRGDEQTLDTKVVEKDLQALFVILEPGRHLLYLENGTHRMLPRPWFRPSLQNIRRKLEDIAGTNYKQAMK